MSDEGLEPGSDSLRGFCDTRLFFSASNDEICTCQQGFYSFLNLGLPLLVLIPLGFKNAAHVLILRGRQVLADVLVRSFEHQQVEHESLIRGQQDEKLITTHGLCNDLLVAV